MKRNIIFTMISGQRLRVDDVSKITLDANGIHVEHVETSTEKRGEEMVKVMQPVLKWFNTAGVISYTEEWVKA